MRLMLFLVFSFTCFFVQAQVSFATIVPTQPVAAGESFQVQYVLTGSSNAAISYAAFPNYIRLVAGPAEYTGTTNTPNGILSIRNVVYTIETKKKGTLIIPGTSATANGKTYFSNSTSVLVLSKEEIKKAAASTELLSDYILKPGEDPYQKIKQNLFVKVTVNKKNCYIGEPVLATFKLYSRLQAKADIVKNPGLYGFSVYDMENLESKVVVTEKINGKEFDVHTIRKAQLFPLQSGNFFIDPMVIKNKVAFSKTTVYKKTEQEIAEGMLNNQEDNFPTDAAVYETELSTEQIAITVNILPEKNKPSSFTGATGNFSITAQLEKSSLPLNEQGILLLTIKGEGNFIQLDAPTIQWPEGMESFAPTVTDSLNKTAMPLSGSRTFRFPFVCAQKGKYSISPISFSYFSRKENAYKQLSTAATTLLVTDSIKKPKEAETNHKSIAAEGEKISRKALFIVFAIVVAVLLYLLLKKKENKVVAPPVVKPVINIDEILQPVHTTTAADAKIFYSALHKAIWQFVAERFEMSGSEMNKTNLQEKFESNNIGAEESKFLITLIQECETGMYTAAIMEPDKEVLLQKTKKCCESINNTVDE